MENFPVWHFHSIHFCFCLHLVTGLKFISCFSRRTHAPNSNLISDMIMTAKTANARPLSILFNQLHSHCESFSFFCSLPIKTDYAPWRRSRGRGQNWNTISKCIWRNWSAKSTQLGCKEGPRLCDTASIRENLEAEFKQPKTTRSHGTNFTQLCERFLTQPCGSTSHRQCCIKLRLLCENPSHSREEGRWKCGEQQLVWSA